MAREGHTTIIPNRFVNVIRHISKEKNMDIFTTNAQNDLSEFLTFIVNTIHTEMVVKIQVEIPPNLNDIDKKCFEMIKSTYSDDYSFIIEYFYGIYVTIIDTPDKVLSIKPDPFFILDLSIPTLPVVTLEDCLKLYVQSETIEWKDETTNEIISASKKNRFWRMPKLLFIVFKRFDNFGNKNNTMVHVPLQFTMNNIKYILLSVCNHSGNTNHGHYTCNVRNEQWYEINDECVNIIPECKVITPNAYCLLFSQI
jgi:ubiquitin C-terminal hydrolase